MYKEIKRFLTSSPKGRRIDEFARRVLATIPLLHGGLSKYSLRRAKSPVDTIVFFLHGGIGDCLMMLPALIKLKKNFRVVVFLPSHALEAVRCFVSDIDFVTYQSRQSFLSVAEKIRHAAGPRSVFIFSSPVIEVYVLFLLSRIKRAFGLIGDFSRIRSIGFGGINFKVVDKSRVGLNTQIADLFLSALAVSDARASVSVPIDLQRTGRTVIINPNKTKTWPAGRWIPDRFATLADSLIDNYDVEVLFVGSEAEAEYVAKIVDRCRHKTRIQNIAGKTDLADLVSLIERAGVVVTTDSGIMHIAAAAKAPCVALFSFSDPDVFAWPGATIPLFEKKYECMPCVSSRPDPVDNYPFACPYNCRCDAVLTVESVVAKAGEFLR